MRDNTSINTAVSALTFPCAAREVTPLSALPFCLDGDRMKLHFYTLFSFLLVVSSIGLGSVWTPQSFSGWLHTTDPSSALPGQCECPVIGFSRFRVTMSDVLWWLWLPCWLHLTLEASTSILSLWFWDSLIVYVCFSDSVLWASYGMQGRSSLTLPFRSGIENSTSGLRTL